MTKEKKTDIDKKVDLGPDKDEHISQYGKQDSESSRKIFDSSDDNTTGSYTISNKSNAVQDNAHMNPKLRSKQ